MLNRKTQLIQVIFSSIPKGAWLQVE